jgi:cytochrome c2
MSPSLAASELEPRLTIELVPSTQWGANLSQSLKGRRWDVLRKETYRRAGDRCEVCGGVGIRHAVEAHEVWEYEQETGTQRLVRLIALCPACHEVKHFGRAQVIGRGAEAGAHLAAVNGWSEAEAKAYVASAGAAWRERNKVAWTLDLSVLSEYGVEPPSEAELAAGRERTSQKIQRRQR